MRQRERERERRSHFGSSREWFKAAALRKKRASNLERGRVEGQCEECHRADRRVRTTTRPRAEGPASGHSRGRSSGATAGWRRAGDTATSYLTPRAYRGALSPVRSTRRCRGRKYCPGGVRDTTSTAPRMASSPMEIESPGAEGGQERQERGASPWT